MQQDNANTNTSFFFGDRGIMQNDENIKNGNLQDDIEASCDTL